MTWLDQTQSQDFITLCQWIAGDFSNRQQAFADPKNFAHIHIFFKPLPFDFFNAIGFYSEQVYDYDLWTPYRQGVHRVIDQGDQIYIENYGLIDRIRYAGAAREATILKTLSQEVIQPRCGCAMVFRRQTDHFVGTVEPGNGCVIPKDGIMTYLVSEVLLTETTWESRDRGFHPDTHEQVWGSEHGALKFEKIQDFSADLP